MNLKLPANWLPKLSGLLIAFAGFVKFDTSIHFPQWMESLASFLMVGGPAALGFSTKQWNVTGGTVANKSNDPNVVAGNAGMSNGSTPGPPKQ